MSLNYQAQSDLENRHELEIEGKGMGTSNCCGAGTYGEMLICEDCGEHCGDEEVELYEDSREGRADAVARENFQAALNQ